MSNFKFSESSLNKLAGARPELQTLFKEGIKISPYDIGIGEVVRDYQVQKQRVDTGSSGTMHSMHIPDPSDGYSYAVDYLVYDENGQVTWKAGYFRKVTQALVTVAIEHQIQVSFGALWKDISRKIKGPDCPHVELNREFYPRSWPEL